MSVALARFRPAIAIAFLAGVASAVMAADGLPNVVLFLVDDLGYGDLPTHGNQHVRAPHIDRFAGQSMELSRFYVSPVCSPTRASLLTGRYNFRTGVADVRVTSVMKATEVTLAEALRTHGYATGLFGKWHLGNTAGHDPNSQGFDETLTFAGSTLRPRYQDPRLLHNNSSVEKKGYCTDVFVDAAIEFISENRARPFFAYVPTNVVHAPLEFDTEQTSRFRDGGLSDSTARVYGMMENLDANFGRLLAKLHDLGLEEKTIVIFMSDNGPASESVPLDRNMSVLRGLKGTVYENGVRVPFYVRWPGNIPGGQIVDRIAAHIDIMPTILAACGQGTPKGVAFDGIDLLPLLRNPSSAAWPDRTIFVQWDSGDSPRRGAAFAAISEKWKLVQPCGIDDPRQKHIINRYAELCRLQNRGPSSIAGLPRHELYAIASDPGERWDIARDQPKVVQQLLGKYEAWFTDVCADWPQTPPRPDPPENPVPYQ